MTTAMTAKEYSFELLLLLLYIFYLLLNFLLMIIMKSFLATYLGLNWLWCECECRRNIEVKKTTQEMGDKCVF